MRPYKQREEEEKLASERMILPPKDTRHPEEEPENWRQKLTERPWVIRGQIWDTQGRWAPRED
jgi:hypothetical protein